MRTPFLWLATLAALVPLLGARLAQGEPPGPPPPPDEAGDRPYAPVVSAPQASSAPPPPPASSEPPAPPRPAASASTEVSASPPLPPAPLPDLDAEARLDPRRLGGGFARTSALGGGSATNGRDENPFLQDATYVINNPAYASIYGNYIWGNLGRPVQSGEGSGGSGRVQNLSELTMIGGHFRATPRWTLGLLVGVKDSILFDRRPSTDLEQLNPKLPTGTFGNPLLQSQLATGGTSLTGDRFIANTYGVLVAYEASPVLRMGMQVYTGYLSSDIQQQSENPAQGSAQREQRKASTVGGNLGVVLGTERRLEVALRMRINSASREVQNNAATTQQRKEQAPAAPEVGLQARAFLPLRGALSLVPLLRASWFGWSTSTTQTPAPAVPVPDNNYQAIDAEAGAGLNLRLPGALLVGGLSVSYLRDALSSRSDVGSESTERSQSIWVLDLPRLHLGAEVYLRRWLTARLGYFKRTAILGFSENTTVKSGGQVASFQRTAHDYGAPFGRLSSGNLLSLGLGANLADFHVDAAISLFDDAESSKLLSQLSAHYLF